MTGRYLTLHQQTKLTMNIIIEDDTGALVLSLLFVTQILRFLWQLSCLVVSVKYQTWMFISDLKIAMSFSSQVLAIIFKAFVYGFGVKL